MAFPGNPWGRRRVGGEGNGWHGKCSSGERWRQFALVPSGRRIWRRVPVTVVTEPHQPGDGLIAFAGILVFFKSVFESWCRGDRVPQANARPCGVRRCTANSRCGIHSIHGHFGRLVFGRQKFSLDSTPHRNAYVCDRCLFRSGGGPRPAMMSMTPAGAFFSRTGPCDPSGARGFCDAHSLYSRCRPVVRISPSERPTGEAESSPRPPHASAVGRNEVSRFLFMDTQASCFSLSVVRATIEGAA